MSDAKGGTPDGGGTGDGDVELGTWRTPDGLEIQVPVGQLDGLNGINQRFNDLTKKEQAIAEKEKTFAQQLADAEEAAKDAAFEGLDKESLLMLAQANGIDLTEAEAEQVTDDDVRVDPELAKTVEALRERLDAKDAAEKEAAENERYAAAQTEVANALADIAEESEEFKALASDHFQDLAFSEAWKALDESNYNMSNEDAMAAGIAASAAIQTAAVEAYTASKASGPGAPGKAAGEVARPESFAKGEDGDAQRSAHMKAFAKALLAQAGG